MGRSGAPNTGRGRGLGGFITGETCAISFSGTVAFEGLYNTTRDQGGRKQEGGRAFESGGQIARLAVLWLTLEKKVIYVGVASG